MSALRQIFKSDAANALGVCCVLLALGAYSSATYAQAGYVHEVSGKVFMQKSSTTAIPEKVGNTFEPETLFRTGADGRMTLKFADGQIVALGENSTLRIGQYHFVANNIRQSTSSMVLIKGEMRYVSGAIGANNREGVRIFAGQSALNILKPGGADFSVMVKTDPQETGIAAVSFGEIGLLRPNGQINRIAPGQFVPWQPGRAPALPAPLAAAPAVVQAAERAVFAVPLPSNTPVAVEPAARTAVAVAAASQAQADSRVVRVEVEAPTRTAPVAAEGGGEQSVSGAGAVCTQFSAAGLVGYVHDASGPASIQRGTGSEIAANTGYAFDADSVFRTDLNGNVTLKFADGQLVVLGPDSAFRVDQYRFNTGDVRQSTSSVELMKGNMRFVTGAIGAQNREAVRISAGNSTISILKPGGADFTVVVNPDPHEAGVSAVLRGEISIQTVYGQTERVTAGQYLSWQSGRDSAGPAPTAAAPAALQMAEQTIIAIALPANTPVGADSAACKTIAALAALEPTAAGPEATPAAPAPAPSPIAPAVTPGGPGGGGRVCVGSPC